MIPLWLGTELGGSLQEYGTSVARNRARREFTRIWYLCGREQSYSRWEVTRIWYLWGWEQS
jgi:hypothetical protein